MTTHGSPLTARRPRACRPALLAARTAGIAAVVLALAGLAVPAAGAAAAPSGRASAGTGGWAIQPTPNPLTSQGQLAAVSCTSPSTCIAVGGRQDRAGAGVTLAESWNGTAWSVLKTPNPSGANRSSLVGVSCTSATFCIAVGTTDSGSSTLAEAWNGTSWSIRQTPSVPGAQFNGVSCTTPTACTIVGFNVSGTARYALAERWNGTSWSVQSTAPGTPASSLASV